MTRISISLLGAALLCVAPIAATAHEPNRDRDHQYEQDRIEERRQQRRDQQRRQEDRDARRHPHHHHDAYGGERRGWTHQIGGGGGWFAPWQGNDGYQAQLEFLSTSPGGHFRFGGEFVTREFRTRIFDVDNVNVDSYQGNLVFHGVLNPGRLTPYVGVGIGLHANDFSKSDIERGNPALNVRDDVGLGYGVFGILGLELPIGTELSLFAEGRLNLAYQVTGFDRSANGFYADYHNDRVDRADAEDMGGGSAVFGARVRF